MDDNKNEAQTGFPHIKMVDISGLGRPNPRFVISNMNEATQALRGLITFFEAVDQAASYLDDADYNALQVTSDFNIVDKLVEMGELVSQAQDVNKDVVDTLQRIALTPMSTAAHQFLLKTVPAKLEEQRKLAAQTRDDELNRVGRQIAEIFEQIGDKAA